MTYLYQFKMSGASRNTPSLYHAQLYYTTTKMKKIVLVDYVGLEDR